MEDDLNLKEPEQLLKELKDFWALTIPLIKLPKLLFNGQEPVNASYPDV